MVIGKIFSPAFGSWPSQLACRGGIVVPQGRGLLAFAVPCLAGYLARA